MADDRQVNEVIINGETVVNLRKDTVAENNLMEEETATNHEGRKIEGEFNGASEDDAYLVSDPIGDIEEEDYVPFNDISDTEMPKKKTLFSDIIGKLADFFISKRGTNGNYTIDNDSQTMYMKHNKIDASKVDNNVTSTTYPSLSNILDKDGRIIMRTEAVVMPDGKIGWKAYVNNYDTSGTRIAQRGLKFYEDKTGAMTFEVDDPRAFRKAVDSIDQLGASLPRNTVIDDYHADSYTGTYYFADDGVASTIVTLPEAVCGKLIVTNNGNGGFSQYYIPNHSVKIWVRVWWSNAWSAWQDLASGSKPHTYDIGTKIPQNSDLNTYITCGTYHVAGNADAETISNLPYPCAGKLLVLTINNDSSNNPRLYQLYFSVFNSYVYSRYRDFAGVWTAWEQIVNTESVHLLSEPDLSHSITENQDLNDFTQSGTWQCRLASTASTLSNCPVSVPFKLVVDRQYINSKSELTQRITCLNSINLQGGEWYRTKTYNVSTWGEWIHVVFASNNVNGNKNGLQIYPTVSNGTRGVLKWNDADDTHLNHNFYDGTGWVGSKTLANIDDIVYYTLGNTIPDNADLNDYTTNGIYNIGSTSRARTISNMPCGYAGKLIVMRVASNQYVKQIFIPYDSLNNYQGFYERTYNGDTGGGWRGWRKFVESNDGKIELYQETTTAEDKYVGISAKILDTTTANSYSRDILKIYQDHQSTPYGFNLLLEGGGSTIIGSGEAASSHYNVLSKPLINEDLYITADGIIILQAKGNTINERKGFRITTNQELLPCIADVATNGVGSIGSSDYKLANIYTERINGSVPPTSDELNTAIAKVGKSILPSWSYASNVRTSNGITYTFNPTTGEITANGTATADTTCGIAGVGLSQYTIPKGTYTLSGCPSGGASDKYGLMLNLVNMNQVDYGSGVTFTLTSEHVCDDNQHLYIFVKSGVTASNLVFRPMLRPAYTSDTYEPCEDIHKGNCYVGTCTTAANQQVKVAYVDGFFNLRKGVRVAIKFSNTNTYSSSTSNPVTLNVNGTGAKNIWYNSTHSGAGNTGTASICYGTANRYVYYVYDGTYWVWEGQSYDNNSTNYLRNDASSTLTANGSAYLNVKSSNIDLTQADNGVTTTQYPGYIIQDKNGMDMTRLETVVETNGQTRTYLQVCNYNTTTASHFRAGIYMYTNKSQDMWYGLTNPHYFHRELGFGYGTCSTAADQRVKVVTMARFRLVVGGIIGVKFTNTNTYNATADNKVCLNVNGTGEKPIYYNTGYSTGTNTTAFGIANRVHYYMYDGTNWCWLNSGCEDNTVDPRQLGSGYGTCDTAAATAAKVVTMSGYALRTGGILSVKFTNAVPANATMNINSRGAKSIYYRGSAIPANIIRAGDRCLFVYNGSQYDLLSVDRDSIERNNVIAWSDIAFGTNVPSMSSANSNVWGDIRSNLLLANMRFSTSASGTIPANNSSSGGFFRISKFAPYTWRMVHVTYGNTYVPAYLDNITYNGTSGLMVVLRNSLSVAQNADICVSFEVELE